MIPFGKRPKKLPAVLSGEEVNRLLSCVKCHKHRTFLVLQYACGLRLNEAAHLKISDIDSQRMQIRVDCGKGQKTNEAGGMRLEVGVVRP
jgi:site-specific recombinase XerD